MEVAFSAIDPSRPASALWVTAMLNHLFAALIFAASGLWLHLVYRAWYRHLINLAASHSVERRRKLAALCFPLPLLAVALSFFGAFYSVVQFYPRQYSLSLPVMFGVSCVPNIVWWLRRCASLEALGYGNP